ncbi:MAG: RagB/SusD family nutrient uptake outer membrane protein, partial [Tannerella sp.]|nr:RagB/SusD family nutrient uptake outer membrane protein [Tannerella sp.]
ELDLAVSELPAVFSGAEKGRATSIAALALKSRILLYAASDLMNVEVESEHTGYLTPASNRWNKAADAAKTCIEQALAGGYGLYDRYGDDVKQNYTQLFLDGGNEEVLFDRQGTTSADGESINTIDQTNGPNGYGLWGGNTPLQELVDAFEIDDGTAFDWNDPERKKNPYANRDRRLYAYVLCDGDPWKEREVECFIDADANSSELTSGGRDSKYGGDSWNTSLTGYNMRKFMDESYVPNSWNVRTPKNWIWFRLAEQYLNLAEAYHMAGNEDDARKYLNVIRRRARMPDVYVSGTELLDKIRNERRIELAFEEHRYYDVRRWRLGEKYLNKTVTGITILKLPDGTKIYTPGKTVEERKFFKHMYWLPIPKGETDKNPRIAQNPGY